MKKAHLKYARGGSERYDGASGDIRGPAAVHRRRDGRGLRLGALMDNLDDNEIFVLVLIVFVMVIIVAAYWGG